MVLSRARNQNGTKERRKSARLDLFIFAPPFRRLHVALTRFTAGNCENNTWADCRADPPANCPPCDYTGSLFFLEQKIFRCRPFALTDLGLSLPTAIFSPNFPNVCVCLPLDAATCSGAFASRSPCPCPILPRTCALPVRPPTIAISSAITHILFYDHAHRF